MEHKLVPNYERLGYALAARVLQSDLYGQLDDVERAQCDELLAAPDELSDAEIARLFHDTYEERAPFYGYITRKDTRHFDPESQNGKLMIEVCGIVANALAKRGIRQQGEDYERLEREHFGDAEKRTGIYAAEQRTAAQQDRNGRGSAVACEADKSAPVPAASAALTREQIEILKDTRTQDVNRYDYDNLCDMALRYRDLLEQEPVAWKVKSHNHTMLVWHKDFVRNTYDTGEFHKLIVAPGGEK